MPYRAALGLAYGARALKEANVDNSREVGGLFDSIADEYHGKTVAKGRYDAVREDPRSAFHPAALSRVEKCIGSVDGARICVPGSGDNVAALAFALMGAKVTSVDVSRGMLAHARLEAERAGACIDFVEDNAMSLAKIADGSFDMVYTSNGFFKFISDLDAFAASASRILKLGGTYLAFDAHPFMFPFAGYLDRVVVKKPYEAVGPFAGGLAYHWRIGDVVNSLSRAGFCITGIDEPHAEPGTFWTDMVNDPRKLEGAYDWHRNPLAALPQWIVIEARLKPPGLHAGAA